MPALEPLDSTRQVLRSIQEVTVPRMLREGPHRTALGQIPLPSQGRARLRMVVVVVVVEASLRCMIQKSRAWIWTF